MRLADFAPVVYNWDACNELGLLALSPPAEEATKDFLRASRLTETGKAGCYNRWGTTSAIAGRVIDV
ncbi:hypothetical protein CGZ93_04710 [Enemella dayhoffiae]|uniref:Uncharacterized protein n=2 Tax=Enemella dayhoffiae TaxID=2016507 RepID=A0A255HAT0_9ACTN|nr:hypothetical protein CGZ93_04710 [Enemella dayhoffiae]